VLVIELFLRRRRMRDLLIPLGIWAAVSMPAILLAQASQAQPEVYTPELMWRLLVALDALAFYLWKLVLPAGLAPDYGRSPRWLLGEGPVLYTWMAPAVLLTLAYAVRDKARWPLACLLLFVAALLPTLGLVPFDYQRYSTVADRYAYLALLAPALALAWVLARYPRSTWTALALLVVGGLGVMAARQTMIWRDTQTLFRQTLAVNPKSLAALTVFAYVEDLEGRPDKALEMYGQALENNPGDPRTMYNIGNVYLGQGKPSEAAAAYRQALGGMGRHSTLRSNFGLALAQLGRLDEAKVQLEEAVAINPRNAHAHLSLGTVLVARRDFAGARQHYETALRIDPKLDAARDALEKLRAAGR
jgi:tetratricopeptide (TPR) repeat protein